MVLIHSEQLYGNEQHLQYFSRALYINGLSHLSIPNGIDSVSLPFANIMEAHGLLVTRCAGKKAIHKVVLSIGKEFA